MQIRKCTACAKLLIHRHQKLFCSRICSNQHQNKDVEARFWKLVIKTESGCWGHKKWVDGRKRIKGKSAYWQLTVDGKRIYGHRFSWELHFGTIPNGLKVCHTCDNTMCSNPSHLFLGTTQENSDDMVAKGRSARGSKHGNAKLTEKQVKEIKNEYRRISYRKSNTHQLAKKHVVTSQIIIGIISGKSWKHVK